jgi:CHAT domain-containing protein
LVLAAACGKPDAASESQIYQAAEFSLKRGDLERAQVEAETRAAAWQNEPESYWLWSYRILNGETLIAQGRAKDALQVLEASFPEAPQLSPLAARWKAVRASALLRVAQIQEAQKLVDEAEALAANAGQLELIPRIKSTRAQLLRSLNRNEEAERELRSSLEHAIEQDDLYYQAAALNNLGLSRIDSARFDDAIPLLQQALAAAEKAGAVRIASAATTNLGLCANNLGDFDAALVHYQKAIEIQRQQGSKPFLQASLGEMGNIYMRQNDARKSIPYYREALAIAHEVNATSDESKWAGNLAEAFILLEEWDQAEQHNKQALALKERANDAASLVHSRLNEAKIAAGRAQPERAEALYEETIRSAGGNSSVLWDAHAGMGQLFRTTGDSVRSSQQFEEAIRWIEDARSGTNYKITFLARLIQFYQDYVDALVDQKEYDKALRVAESSRARVLSEKLALTGAGRHQAAVDNYQQLARQSGSVLLSYWLAPKRSFVWVITPKTRGFFELPPQKQIASWVESHQTLILNLRDPLTAGPIAADRLYEALLAPARQLIPAGSRVVVVPDGPLHSLNFETLTVPGDERHYWIEDVTVSIATSLNGQFGRAPRRPQSLLLIGDADPGVAEFQRLPSAAREIRSIQERLGSIPKTVHQGTDARPSAYRASQPEKFSIIHFASHATANRESPPDSAIILSRESDALSPYRLYARDLIAMPLNADLVTISGCRSAGARIYSGEGLVGFTWAFLHAGARNVIAGLWDVSDASTAELMDHLYRGIQTGQSPETALRAAKLALIQSPDNVRKPYYWAPFQVYSR